MTEVGAGMWDFDSNGLEAAAAAAAAGTLADMPLPVAAMERDGPSRESLGRTMKLV